MIVAPSRFLEGSLAGYPNHPESKFLGGEPFGVGPTRPRHVRAGAIAFVGKEADRWEEDFYFGVVLNTPLRFGSPYRAADALYNEMRHAAKAHGVSEVARQTGLTRSAVSHLLEGVFVKTKVKPAQIRAALRGLADHARSRKAEARRREHQLARALRAHR
jgi:hypothetical protein